MAFMEKLGSMMQRPSDNEPGKGDDVPWWMRYAGRGVGTIGSLIAIGLGFSLALGIILAQVMCMIAGIWQMLSGFVVIMIEAPCCCMFVDFVQNVSDVIERRPYWNKGLLYILLSLPAIFMCPGLGTIFGSGFIFATGVIYGLMSLGKKAPKDEMRQRAGSSGMTGTTESTATGGNMGANLVANAQPMATTKPPFDNFRSSYKSLPGVVVVPCIRSGRRGRGRGGRGALG